MRIRSFEFSSSRGFDILLTSGFLTITADVGKKGAWVRYNSNAYDEAVRGLELMLITEICAEQKESLACMEIALELASYSARNVFHEAFQPSSQNVCSKIVIFTTNFYKQHLQ